MQGKFLDNEFNREIVTLDDGKKQITIRCRESFVMPVGQASLRNSLLGDDVAEDSLTESEDAAKSNSSSKVSVVEGIASSTSVDFYGTEMSAEALAVMSKQMTRGIPLLPRHQSLSGGGTAEWDEVIGRTLEAEIVPRAVDAPAEASEPQYVLKATSVLYDEEPLAQSLRRRLERGEPIGQSIGGWFTNVRVIQNDDGDISRVIVDEVELDHLAITRAPANPDSRGLYTLRSRAEEFARSLCKGDSDSLSTRDEEDAPDYRKADDEDQSCSTCEYIEDDNQCVKHDFQTDSDMVCNSWEGTEGESLPTEERNGTVDIKDSETRSSPAAKDLPLAPPDTEWDLSSEDEDEILGEEGNDWDRYAKAHFYVSDDDDRETKGAYKLPFAKMMDGELTAVWRGVAAAMAALNGARGGVDIPDDQLDEVYDKISEYYRRFDKEAPLLERASNKELDSDSTNGVSDESSLDVRAETVYDKSDDVVQTSDETPADAQRGAIPDPLSTFKDEPMTDTDLEKISELISRSVGGLVERVSSIEENLSAKTESAPAVEPTDEIPAAPADSEELIALRAKLKTAESRLARLAEYGVRHGIHSTAQVVEPARGPGADSEWRSLINAHESEAGVKSHLSTYVERNIENLSEAAEKNSQSRRELEETLRKGLRCAIADGLLNASAPSSWR